jgi:hypothetical protein
MKKLLTLVALAGALFTQTAVAEPNYCNGLDQGSIYPTDPNNNDFYGILGTGANNVKYVTGGYSGYIYKHITITCRYKDTTGFHNVTGFPKDEWGYEVGASAGPFNPCSGITYVELTVKDSSGPQMLVTWDTSK